MSWYSMNYLVSEYHKRKFLEGVRRGNWTPHVYVSSHQYDLLTVIAQGYREGVRDWSSTNHMKDLFDRTYCKVVGEERIEVSFRGEDGTVVVLGEMGNLEEAKELGERLVQVRFLMEGGNVP